jgi:4-hydroxy-3-polyprenylbenzoate decarboxylase
VCSETPISAIHLQNIQGCKIGVVILPAMPGFYHKPRTIEDLVDHLVGKILDQFGIEHNVFRRWGGDK